MGKSFVYNTGSSKDDIKPNELRFEFGVFIDGTLNNKTNTEMRRKYRKEDEKSIINKGSEKDKNDLAKEAKDYKKIKDNDFKLAPQGTPEREYQDYLIGIHRTKIDKQGTDNSYSNDYTNVARMWRCCDCEKYAIYVEGMGTGDLQYDSPDGFAFGSGLTGIRNRVRKACEAIVKKIQAEKNQNTTNSKKKITEITLDVFGFSRGAASARNFVYEVNKGEYNTQEIKIPDGFYPINPYREQMPQKKYRKAMGDADGLEIDETLLIDGKMPRMGHLGYSLLKNTDITPEELEDISLIIRFIGIYDTVSSYYEVGALGSYKADGTLEDDGKFGKLAKEVWSTHFNDDEEELNLHLNPKSFQKMVHFTAKDEHRRNFSLTCINQIVDKAIERNYPGVHCDIGGAYENGIETIDEIGTSISDHNYKIETLQSLVSPILPIITTPGLKSLKQDLIEKYWYKEKELEINTQWGWIPPITSYRKLTGTRFVKKEYSWVFLHFMEEFARQTTMDSFFKDKTTERHPIAEDSFLGRVKKHLYHYTFTGGEEWEFKSDAQLKIEKEDRQKQEELEKNLKKIDVKEEKEKFLRGQSQVVQDGLSSEIYEPKIIIDNEVPFKKDFFLEKVIEQKTIQLKEVVVVGFSPQMALRKLRHEYCHWSSNRDWFGMEPPNSDRKRKYFYPK